MDIILYIFFGTLAFVLAIFVALMIFGATISAADRVLENAGSDPSRAISAMGVVLAAFSVFYLMGVGLMAMLGDSDFEAMNELTQVFMMNGYGVYVGLGGIAFGVVMAIFGKWLEG